MFRAVLLLSGMLLAAGCLSGESGLFPEGPDAGRADAGDSGTSSAAATATGSTGGAVTIQNYTFIPVELFVAPGDTIAFTNLDGDTHTVTSQTDPGSYQLGEVNGVSFDLPAFTGTRTFTIPATAPRGTVIYYFDRVYRERMKNQPRITIQ